MFNAIPIQAKENNHCNLNQAQDVSVLRVHADWGNAGGWIQYRLVVNCST